MQAVRRWFQESNNRYYKEGAGAQLSGAECVGASSEQRPKLG